MDAQAVVRIDPATMEVALRIPTAAPPRHLAVDESGEGEVSEPRMYQLIRQRGPIRQRTFEIRFLDPGVRAYVFTFG